MSINKNHLIEIAPKALSESVAKLPNELIEMDLIELEKKYKPNPKDRLLRRRFQNEFNDAMRGSRPFCVANVHRNIIHENTWYGSVVTNKYRLAYLLHPIQDMEDELKVLEEDFLNGLREIAAKGPYGTNVRMSDYLSAAKMVLSRTAPIIQKQEVKQMTLKADLSKGQMTDEQINEKLDAKLQAIIEDRKGTPVKQIGEGRKGKK